MKTLYVILGILLVVLGGYFLFGRDNGGANQGDGSEFAAYMEEQMTTLGVRGGMIPIEGFDADLLISAFPGLQESDFQNVETFEGHYELQAGDLVFVRDQEQPISSAERTVSRDGYGTLLENVAERLVYDINSERDVDALIEAINTKEFIETRIDQGASVYGIEIVPTELLEDSRCPVDVECIQAGTVRIRARVESETGPANYIFELFSPLTLGPADVTLVEVNPAPESNREIGTDDYIFIFEVVDRL